MVAFTVEIQDWPDQWKEITKSPFKFFRGIAFVQDNLVAVWGKSFRKGRNVTTPDDSTSVQAHALIKSSSVLAVLRAAGSAKIWITPKLKCGKPDSDWKLLWLDPAVDIQKTVITCAKVPDAAGFARVKGRFAIRTQYAAAWAILFPSVPLPELVDVKPTWKLESLPFGTAAVMLQEWSKHVGWQFRPLRAVGPREWIVGASDKPPTTQLRFQLWATFGPRSSSQTSCQQSNCGGPKTHWIQQRCQANWIATVGQ